MKRVLVLSEWVSAITYAAYIGIFLAYIPSSLYEVNLKIYSISIFLASLFSFLQTISLAFQYDLAILRIMMAWISGIWWLSFGYIFSLVIGVEFSTYLLVLGGLNMGTFFYLIKNSNINLNTIFDI